MLLVLPCATITTSFKAIRLQGRLTSNVFDAAVL
jgi:hypothetical protein